MTLKTLGMPELNVTLQGGRFPQNKKNFSPWGQLFSYFGSF
ncbi:hypothetical protein COO91_11009 (plasmid) [Nostoc flagelliforme CCNUN1]|uniref:Uncharacterized protein n=1 Tax=Nostoc flagelliforme CCNUN1 TaxID=2038116 RepID=A0A2K8TAP3_9NOSO|nr:hypothetical protein COO91_11009 [Nostoc flagelliforme CCNUN1]